MADFNERSTISITCPMAMASFLQEEVRSLGYKSLKVRQTGLDLKGSLNDAIKLNFWLRTAHRIHFLIDEKRSVRNPDSLYKWLNSIPWEKYIPVDGYLAVTSRIDHPSIDNTQFANLKVKDAIVDRIRMIKGHRPDSGPDLNRTVVFLYWDKSIARIFLDTSGESLSRRGYRTESVSAPLQESLAAAIIQASGWQPEQHFINPMCGSGTLAIEAVLKGLNRPPASLRHDFGFMHIEGYSDDFYMQIRSDARSNTKKEIHGKIIATDNDPAAIKAAKKNAITAGVDHLIRFEICDLEDTPVPDGKGVVILNPPYGERLNNPEQLSPLYSQIGDFFKNRCPGKTGFVLTGNFDLAKKIGLRTSQRIPFFNSTIECRLLEYELYKGSRSK
jgi:23S rRNA G2445 N2-methylase RlmL